MKTYTDSNFEKTNKKARITFLGWDGKSYNGEAVNRTVYTNKQYPEKRFVMEYMKGWKCYHEITGKTHAVTGAVIVECFAVFEPIEK